MTSGETPVVSPAPCIDAALKTISATRMTLGSELVAVGWRFDKVRNPALRETIDLILKWSGELRGLCSGVEAWHVNYRARYLAITAELRVFIDVSFLAARAVDAQGRLVLDGRSLLDDLMMDLNSDRKVVLALLAKGDPISLATASRLDVELSSNVMFKYDQVIKDLKFRASELVAEYGKICQSSEECGVRLEAEEGQISKMDTSPKFLANGRLDRRAIPIRAMLQLGSRYVTFGSIRAGCSSELKKAVGTGETTLERVRATHGTFFESDLIPALADYAEKSDALVYLFGDRIRKIGQFLCGASARYNKADLLSQALLTSRSPARYARASIPVDDISLL